MKRILVTGGTGFIGSHTTLELLEAGFDVVVMDNLHNSKTESLNRVRQITGKEVVFHKLDLLDTEGLSSLFKQYTFDGVIHFAGLKAVGESVEDPLLYYKNNISGTVNLCEAMSEAGIKNLVFSSSATVYGDPETSPIPETAPVTAVNPYGRTKLTIEYILKDLYRSDPEWNIALLRYFNPVGAHESGLIGEDPNGIPNNLMPFVTQVAVGKLDKLNIFGDDYPTHDGTGVRDYIHVTDLSVGHLKALEKLEENPGVVTYNLGTGNGSSVLDVVKAFEKATGISIPYKIAPRRPGDAAICYADPARAESELNWKTERDLVTMCRDAWNWQSKNPEGF
ncbi:UDP-glucose 4-epimerase GalE [Rhodohalobacter mucosus]|uniref:UDP-glucose 4-epimerase n=1 Tax=Rhodohalobacter mucosus TaxID=2079485 RepID=A0A316TSB1_9BACT|nr:UDP-glucose 4-epimerase GalE [Rhodohalobacter mucosus]PWN07447.1 UDP-glucose 4-epimerase GalE [Rhodohalobacter mucosus]